jgi:hypothetical protein
MFGRFDEILDEYKDAGYFNASYNDSTLSGGVYFTSLS